jgi:hypothetical protein
MDTVLNELPAVETKPPDHRKFLFVLQTTEKVVVAVGEAGKWVSGNFLKVLTFF